MLLPKPAGRLSNWPDVRQLFFWPILLKFCNFCSAFLSHPTNVYEYKYFFKIMQSLAHMEELALLSLGS